MVDSRKVLSLEVGKLTELGSTRQYLVDSLGFYKPTDPELLFARGEMFLVADGMNDDEESVVVARTAAEVIIKKFYHRSALEDIESSLKSAFNLANLRILEQNEDRNPGIYNGAAVTCAVIQKGTLHVAHVGNCRLYLVKGNLAQQLTRDSFSVLPQSLSEPTSMNQPGVHLLGKLPNVEIDYFKRSLRPNDILLLCTDGVHQNLTEREIASIALKYTPQAACEQFLSIINEKPNEDNATIIIIKINGLETIQDEFESAPRPAINLIQQNETPTEEEAVEPAEEAPPKPEEPRKFGRATIPVYNPVEEAAFEDSVSESIENELELEPESEDLQAEELPEPEIEEEKRVEPSYHRPRSERVVHPEFNRVNPDLILGTRSQFPSGLKRRRIEKELPRRSVNFKRYLPIVVSVATALLLMSLIFYVLIQENERFALKEFFNRQEVAPDESESDSLALEQPVVTNPGTTVSKEPEAPEIQAGVSRRAATPVEDVNQIHLVVINGNSVPGKRVQDYLKTIENAGIENAQIRPLTLPSAIFQRSKIIYRFPENGDALRIREAATRVQQAIVRKYTTKLEIINCDISIVIGKDLNLNTLNFERFKRKILDTKYSAPIHVEILNGSGTPKFANQLQKSLDGLLLEDQTFIRVIDARNADHFKYTETILKCRLSEFANANQILKILGFTGQDERISADHLEDIHVVLGADFPKF